jgi:DME family drug/metabolite transporter
LVLFVLAAQKGVLSPVKRLPLAQVSIAGICIATYQLSFFGAVARTGVAIGTIVAIGSAPVLAGILALLFLHERPNTRWLVATILAIAGCTLLILPISLDIHFQLDSSVHLDSLGVTLALAAGASYAIYSLSSKRLLDILSPDAAMALAFCLGALLLLPLLFFQDMSWLASGRGVLVALHLGLVATATAYALFARGLKKVPVSTAVSLSLAEPLTAGLLGLLLLREELDFTAGIGIALIFSGLVLLAIPGKNLSKANQIRQT